MTDQQPEALRLADALDEIGRIKDMGRPAILDSERQAAAELRRLHAENEALKREIASAQAEDQGVVFRTSIGMLWIDEDGVNDVELCPCAAPKLAPGEYALFAKAKQEEK